jgi:hypothetical protein
MDNMWPRNFLLVFRAKVMHCQVLLGLHITIRDSLITLMCGLLLVSRIFYWEECIF